MYGDPVTTDKDGLSARGFYVCADEKLQARRKNFSLNGGWLGETGIFIIDFGCVAMTTMGSKRVVKHLTQCWNLYIVASPAGFMGQVFVGKFVFTFRILYKCLENSE